MRSAASLALRDMRVTYGRTPALDGVSLDVAPGEFMVLLGPSGCGKSTLLAAVAGLQEIAAGQVLLDGQDVTGLDPADRDIAMVFQSYALYPTMTVEQNLGFGMRMRGVPWAEAAATLASVARTLRLEPFLDRKPAQLSGGQRQRVAIGRALVRNPALFLFDEPLSNLDAELRSEMRTEIKRLHQQLGTTTLFVTHDQVEAMTMATRIGVMQAGRILQVGAPRAIYDRPESLFVAGFVGSPGMNVVRGRVVRRAGAVAVEIDGPGGLLVPLDAYAWREPPAEGRAVLLGLRAEDVGLVPAPPGPGAFVAEATPVLVQPTGADTLVRLAFAGTEIVARTHRDHDPALGRPAAVALHLRNASVFCAVSELRL